MLPDAGVPNAELLTAMTYNVYVGSSAEQLLSVASWATVAMTSSFFYRRISPTYRGATRCVDFTSSKFSPFANWDNLAVDEATLL